MEGGLPTHTSPPPSSTTAQTVSSSSSSLAQITSTPSSTAAISASTIQYAPPPLTKPKLPQTASASDQNSLTPEEDLSNNPTFLIPLSPSVKASSSTPTTPTTQATTPPILNAVTGGHNPEAQQVMPGSSDLNSRSLPSNDIRRASFLAGKGCTIQSAGCAPCIDAVSADVILGHSNPKVGDAMASQSLNSNIGLLHGNTADLTRKLVSTLPCSLTTCFFVNSYSEANDLALTMAFLQTGSEEVICLEKADHGKTLAGLRLSKDRTQMFGKAKHVHTASVPDPYRGKIKEGDFPPDDIGWMYSGDVKEICNRMTSEGKKVGAFVCEPVLRQLGQVTLPPRYLHEVANCIKSHSGVLIVDETYTGLGRTGEHMWGFQKFDVVPDIVTVGKSLGNGHPVAAVITSKEIAKKFTSIVSYYNYLGDPTSCAVGLAVLEQLEDGSVMENVRTVGKFLLKKLDQLCQSYDFVGPVRGLGLALGMEMVQPNSKEPNPALAQFVRQKMYECHVVVEMLGLNRNVIGLSPPLTLSVQEATLIAVRLADVFAEANKIFAHSRKRLRQDSGDVCHAENPGLHPGNPDEEALDHGHALGKEAGEIQEAGHELQSTQSQQQSQLQQPHPLAEKSEHSKEQNQDSSSVPTKRTRR